jgi:hypothetical protein
MAYVIEMDCKMVRVPSELIRSADSDRDALLSSAVRTLERFGAALRMRIAEGL